MSSSLIKSSMSRPLSWAAIRASAAFFFVTKAAPLEAFAMRMRASRAFCNERKANQSEFGGFTAAVSQKLEYHRQMREAANDSKGKSASSLRAECLFFFFFKEKIVGIVWRKKFNWKRDQMHCKNSWECFFFFF